MSPENWSVLQWMAYDVALFGFGFVFAVLMMRIRRK